MTKNIISNYKIIQIKIDKIIEIPPIIFLDAIFFKVKENAKIISKAFY
jgi:hypothetical protein